MTGSAKVIKDMAENYAKAWCSLSPEAVASFYAPDGKIAINKGDAIDKQRGCYNRA